MADLSAFSPKARFSNSESLVGRTENGSPRLPEEIAGVLPEFFRKTGCEDWVPMRKPLQRRDCRIHFLRSPGHKPRGVVLKIYRKDAVGKNLAKNLHRKSCKYHEASTPECTIPEPLLFVQEENAILMEHVNAPIAGSLLMKGFHSRERREAIIRKAARWLGWFHRHSDVAAEPFVAAAYTGKLEKTLEKIESLTPGALGRDVFLKRCVDAAARIAMGLDGTEIPHATAHGDFTPFNIFIDGGRAIGFDYRANRRMPVFHDINRFMVYLDVYRITPARVEDLRKYGCRRDDFETFMEIYGTRADEELWLRLQFLEITRRITSLKLPRSKVRNRLFRFIEMAYLRRNARHVLESLEGRGF